MSWRYSLETVSWIAAFFVGGDHKFVAAGIELVLEERDIEV